MASLPRLLLFCDFLENRLHTLSLALLRRVLVDFYAGNEHTLQDFMRLGASVIAVMPVERKDRRHQKEASRLLAGQKGDTCNASGGHDTLCVFRYLSARVATKNILWLRDMFHEFCGGEDAVLREFLRRGNEAISVLPVDIQALCMAPLPPPPLLAETTLSTSETEPSTATSSEVAPSPTLSPQRKRSRGLGSSGGEGRETGAGGRTAKQSRRASVTALEKEAEVAPPPLPADEICTAIMSALKRSEAKEPWKEIFKPGNLSMPFSRVRYPKLAAALQKFWQIHARAVWERRFWSPLARSLTIKLHSQRKSRQYKALSFFEKKVISPVYHELGATFFVELDQRAPPRSGWFYYDQAIDLFTLAQRHGLPTCLQYMESEAFKRFPAVPGQSRKYYSRANGKSRSMWSSAEALRPILNEIVALKTKTIDSSPSVEL
ncbi:hypothetical protein PHYPSEUDO_013314 [Phytophthora pseudosyringae]|uniref:Uncharacterized protein n=1 Tax=Phytophthora pseudosyringae TaxID=221518 RepID=A0A8T1V630_9STRA|nr:hypothetical protein PHYPSEUDO_013314 [Phytophthora pseudosyringae]